MAQPQEQIDYIKNYLYPYKFTNNKTIIVNFLTEIYANIYKRCNSVFDSYTFNEVINLPMIISDKIFSALTGEEKTLTLDDFSQGIYEVFFAPIEDKAQFSFDVYDFNKDNIIEKEDVFLILAHFHLIENTTNSIQYLEDVIDNFFGAEKSIKRDDYINLLSKNGDIFVLMIVFINNYTTLIKDSELRQYKESINYDKFESHRVNFDNFSENFSINSSFEYQISQKLLKYIQKVKLLDFDEYRAYDSTSEESVDDFEDLNIFESDMQDCLQSLSKPKEIEPKLFTDIQSTKRVNDKFAITLNPHENKIGNSGISIFSKANAYKNSLEIFVDSTKKNSSSRDNSYRKIYQNGNKKEITVYKYKKGKKLDKKIKLIHIYLKR